MAGDELCVSVLQLGEAKLCSLSSACRQTEAGKTSHFETFRRPSLLQKPKLTVCLLVADLRSHPDDISRSESLHLHPQVFVFDQRHLVVGTLHIQLGFQVAQLSR